MPRRCRFDIAFELERQWLVTTINDIMGYGPDRYLESTWPTFIAVYFESSQFDSQERTRVRLLRVS